MALNNARYIIDNSANNRGGLAAVRARLEPLFLDRLVATCAVVELEALYSARSPADYAQLSRTRRAIFEYVETEEVDFERALDIQAKLAKNAQLRSGKSQTWSWQRSRFGPAWCSCTTILTSMRSAQSTSG